MSFVTGLVRVSFLFFVFIFLNYPALKNLQSCVRAIFCKKNKIIKTTIVSQFLLVAIQPERGK